MTINNKVSGHVIIEKLYGKDAKKLARKVVQRLSPVKKRTHTITSDNGKEFAEHKLISSEFKVNFYFARPYHFWEKGANENTNELIRQYFTKKNSFDNITNQDVKWVQDILNNRLKKF
ncbi:MAG: IS30 family transposase [Candidatus Omnitrophica bacterium]|nr:IS30 family transposase [Candidatus Omnitrophota bacterium]